MRYLIIISVLPFLVSLDLIAQTKYNFKRIDINSGLAGNGVNEAIQDKNGLIFISTNNGVQKFDMYGFSLFVCDSNSASKVFIDQSQRVWVVSGERALLFPKGSTTFSKIPIFIEDREMNAFNEPSISQDHQGRIWLGANVLDRATPGWQLFIYDEEKKEFHLFGITLQNSPSNILSVQSDKKSDKTGNLWLGTSGGLVYYDVLEKKFYSKNNNPNNIIQLAKTEPYFPIHRLEQDKDGNLVIITWGTRPTFYFIGEHDNTNEISSIISKINAEIAEVRDILVDSNNTIWLAGERLQKINFKTGSYENIALPEDILMINSISEDREGNIWLGTYRGVLIMDPNQRVLFKYNQSADDGLFKRETSCIFQTSDGIVLAGGWYGGGIFFYDQNLNAIEKFGQFTRRDFNDLKVFPAWSFLEDSEHSIWIGAQHGYLVKVDRKNNRIIRYHQDPAFDSKTIRDMCEDKLGNIWFSTQNLSIIRWIKAEGRFSKPTKKEYVDGYIFFHIDAEDNSVWAVGGTFLLQLDPLTGNVLNKYHNEIKLLDNTKRVNLHKIISSTGNELIIASSMGLMVFNKTTHSFNFHKLPSGVTCAEKIKDDQYVLAFSDGSLAEYNRGILNYLDKGNNYNLNSSVKLHNGVVVFGAEINLTILKPKTNESQEKPILPPLITAIQTLNKDLNVDSILSKSLNLNYTENQFSITYSALNFRDRDNIDYYYRIGGKNKVFLNVGHQRTITYAQLPHGEYLIEIFYELPDGRKSPITRLTVIIHPPLWFQPWFLILIGVIITSMILFIYWIRLSKIKDLARVREKISRDLHDEMGSNLSTINILSNVARGTLTKPNITIKVGDILDKIIDLSFQAMESVDEIVWSLNPQNDSFEEIVTRMRVLGGQLLENQNINFMFYLEGEPVGCNIGIARRNDLYLIYKETINNIAKYAKCKNVYVNLSISLDSITLVIADDGIGFNDNITSSGNGLHNMRARSKNLNGQIKISSEINKGTRMELTFAV